MLSLQQRDIPGQADARFIWRMKMPRKYGMLCLRPERNTVSRISALAPVIHSAWRWDIVSMEMILTILLHPSKPDLDGSQNLHRKRILLIKRNFFVRRKKVFQRNW